jgi:hypothetical protein
VPTKGLFIGGVRDTIAQGSRNEEESMRSLKLGSIVGAVLVVPLATSAQIFVTSSPDGDVGGAVVAETEVIDVGTSQFGATVYASVVISSTGITSADCTIIVNAQNPDQVKQSSKSLKVSQKQKDNPQLVELIFGDPDTSTDTRSLSCESGKADANVKTQTNEGKFSTSLKNCTGSTFTASDASALTTCLRGKTPMEIFVP